MHSGARPEARTQNLEMNNTDLEIIANGNR